MDVKAKILHRLVDIDNKCDDCSFFHGTTEALGKTHYLCKLSNILMQNNYACGLYNRNIFKEKICYNCKHFLGGSDWGLSCGANYYTLTHHLDEACKKFETGEKQRLVSIEVK